MPSDSKYQKLSWGIEHERQFIAAQMRQSKDPVSWLAGYLRGLDQRCRGFTRGNMTEVTRTEIRLFALKQLDKNMKIFMAANLAESKQ